MKFKNRPEIWVGAAAFLLRLWFLQCFQGSIFFEPIANGNDRALYDRLAQEIARGRIMPPGVFEYMPLYPWFLGMLYAVAPANLWFAGFVGTIMDACTAAGIVFFARRLQVRTPLAVLGGALYAIYPIAIVYSALTMPNTLNTFLLLCFAWFVHGLKSSDSPGKWFAVGLFGGVLTLGFAGMLLVTAACLIFWIARGIREPSSKPVLWIVFLAGVILPILPVSIHNWRAEHHFVLITAHGGFNFYMGNHENATGYPVQIEGFRGDAGSLLFDARQEAQKKLGHPVTSKEFASYWSGRAWEFIRQHPWQEAKLLGAKTLKFWNYYDYDDLRLIPMLRLTRTAFNGPFVRTLDFVWIACWGLVGLIMARRVGVLRWIALAAMAGMIAFFITARYRLTVAPLLCVLGASGAESLMISKTRVRDGWIVLLAALTVMLPLRSTDFRALDHYNTAAYLLARNEPIPALKQSHAGLSIREDPSLYFVEGNAWFYLGKDRQAENAFRQALRLQPGNRSAHHNLGIVLQREGRTKEAAEELRVGASSE